MLNMLKLLLKKTRKFDYVNVNRIEKMIFHNKFVNLNISQQETKNNNKKIQ